MSNPTPTILGLPVPVFGATGPKYSGKTILGASLAPGVYPEGHPHAGKFRTLILDLEGSSETYGLPCQRVDVPAELRKKHGAKNYRQVDTFLWFRQTIATIPVGRFDVIMVDPISDIEGGGVVWARENPGEFGYTAAQFSKMEGIAIDAAKKMWKAICMDLATRCQIFYFTTHEKLEWVGNKPTKNRLPKGMDYLFECASLYLHLGRDPDIEGQPPKPPFAEVLKSRLAFTSLDKAGELEICEILPKRLPLATKAAILKYVKNPIGRRKAGLSADEIVRDKVLSDDEKLLIAQETALANAQASQSNLSHLELARRAMEGQVVDAQPAAIPSQPEQPAAAVEKLTTSEPGESRASIVTAGSTAPPADQLSEPETKFVQAMKAHDWYYQMSDDGSVFRRGTTSETNVISLAMAVAEPRRVELWGKFAPKRDGVLQFACPGVTATATPPAEVITPPAAPQPISQYKLSEILTLMRQVFASGPEAMAWCGATFGTPNPSLFDSQQDADCLLKLTTMLAEKQTAAVQANAPTPSDGNTASPGSVTEHQRNIIKGLTCHLYGDQAMAINDQFLTGLGLNTARNLSYVQAQARIAQLNQDPRASTFVPF